MDQAFLDLAALSKQGRSGVLATIVGGHGSTYRKPGASAVIAGDGRVIGAISGGCLEQDLMEAARSVQQTGAARLCSYDTGSAEDLLWGSGSGCGGQVTVLLATVPPELLQFVAAHVTAGEPVAVGTVIGGAHLGRRIAVSRSGAQVGALRANGTLMAAVQSLLAQGAARPAAEVLCVDGAEVFVQTVSPAPVLVLIGAGDDAQPVAAMAKGIGHEVTVVDHRPAWLSPARFPHAERLVCDDGAGGADLFCRAGTSVVIMTHNFHQDLIWLERALDSPARYVGLLGARERSQRLTELLLTERPDLRESVMDKLRAPIGLALGADGPAEIALSIVAELLAIHREQPVRASRQALDVGAR